MRRWPLHDGFKGGRPLHDGFKGGCVFWMAISKGCPIYQTALPNFAHTRYLSIMRPSAYVYIITNDNNTVLYTGVSTAISTRLWEHKTKRNPKSFSARYNVWKLVWYEDRTSIMDAVDREKYIKGKSRRWKEALINSMNPEWRDLTDEIREKFGY